MSSSVTNNIIETIEMMTQHAVSSANFDKTIQAVVLQCIDEINGIYKVKYQDSIWKAQSINKNTDFEEGALVYILVPKNDMSEIKTIIGRADSLNKKTETLNETYYLSDIILENGENIITNFEEQELCSYKNMSEQLVIYDAQTSSGSDFSSAEVVLNKDYEKIYLTSSDYFILKADFQTALPTEQRHNGNYGIVIYTKYTDIANQDLQSEKRYVFDANSMIGNPYFFESDTSQTAYFRLDKQLFKEISKITIFSNSFPVQQEGMPNDIFIKNLQIIGANTLSESDRQGNSLHFIYPKGYIFSDLNATSDKKEITAQIRINNKIVKRTKEVPFYWFKEDKRVTIGHQKYDALGGPGWRCLNTWSPQENKFLPAEDTFTITKAEAATQKNNFKCVAVYSGVELANTFSIVNLDSQYEITLTTTEEEPIFFQSSDVLHLVCDWKRRTGQSIIDSDTFFIWNRQDEYGSYQNLEGTGNTLEITGQGVINYSDYSCSVYHNSDLIGSASIRVFKQVKQGLYTLTLVNGVQLFTYDADGNSPYMENKDNNFSIPAVSFSVLDNINNTDVTNQVLSQGQITWSIPIANTLIVDKNDSTIGVIDENQQYIQYTGLSNVIYGIEDRYDASVGLNNIKLNIIFKDIQLQAQTSFLFVKQGESGTNGTGMVCKIIPKKNNKRVTGWLTYINNFDFNCDSLVVELWRDGVNIFSGNQSALSLEGSQVTVAWEMLSLGDNSWYTINTETGDLSCSKTITTDDFHFSNSKGWPANIIKVTLQYQGRKYFDNIPIVTIINSFAYSLKPYSGFKYVTYSSDGEYPQYTNVEPFEILQNDRPSSTPFTWTAVGSYATRNGQYVQLILKNLLEDTYKNNSSGIGFWSAKRFFKPVVKYDGNTVTNALVVTETNFSSSDGIYIHIPIHFMLNRYGQKWLNDWDGNSISIDENNNFILAPQIGAGEKNTQTNTFTGLFMGISSNRMNGNKDIGLFGYNNGIRTIFLDAKTGKAEFGKSGGGQIILDPSTNQAIIKSGNYSEDDETGMMIDLTTPQIKFGSGKFKVDANGLLTAKEGHIGPWRLDENCLYYNPNLNATPALGNLNTRNGAIYLGTAGFSLGNKMIYDSSDGSLTLNVSSLSIRGSNLENKISAVENGKNLFTRSFIDESSRQSLIDVDLLKTWNLEYTYQVRFTNTTTYKYIRIPLSKLNIQANKKYTLSFNFQKITIYDNTSSNRLQNISPRLDFNASYNMIVVDSIYLDNELAFFDQTQFIISLNNDLTKHFITMTFLFSTIPEDSNNAYLFIYFNKGSMSAVDIELSDIMLEQAEEASTWEPSKEDSLIDLQQSKKVAANYLYYDESVGLIVYNGTTSRIRVNNGSLSGLSGYNTRLTSSGMEIWRHNNRKLASYGASTIKFYRSGYNPFDSTQTEDNYIACEIGTDGLDIKKGKITLGQHFSVTNTGTLTAKRGQIAGFNFSTQGLSTSYQDSALLEFTFSINKMSSSNNHVLSFFRKEGTSESEEIFYLSTEAELFTQKDITIQSPGGMRYKVAGESSSHYLITIAADGKNVGIGANSFTTTITLNTETGGSVLPFWSNRVKLGNDSSLWQEVWAGNGVIQTSDEKEKNIIGNLYKYKKIFMNLKPIQFTWKNNNDNQIHFGIGARQTEKVINQYGFKNLAFIQNHNDNYSAIYTELLMMGVPIIQQHETRINQLQQEIKELKGELEKYENK